MIKIKPASTLSCLKFIVIKFFLSDKLIRDHDYDKIDII